MASSSFESLLKKIMHLSRHIYLHVMGEPLLHPEFPYMLELCGKYGFLVNITTNGMFIKKHGEMLLNSNSLRQMNFSIHCAEMQRNSAMPGTYLGDILDFIGKGRQVNNVYFVLRMWNSGSNGKSSAEILGKIWKFFSLPSGIQTAKNDRYGLELVPNVFLSTAEEFTWPDISGSHNSLGNGRQFCLGLRDHFAILVDGSVVPCCIDKDGCMELGNIFESDPDGILGSERAKNIVAGFSQGKAVEDLCQICEFRNRFA